MGGARSLSPGFGNPSAPSVNFTPASCRTLKVLTLPSMPLMAICMTFQSTAVMFPRADLTLAKAGEARTAAARKAGATVRKTRVSDIAAPLPRSSRASLLYRRAFASTIAHGPSLAGPDRGRPREAGHRPDGGGARDVGGPGQEAGRPQDRQRPPHRLLRLPQDDAHAGGGGAPGGQPGAALA